MEFILHLLTGTFLSYIGSAPPGMINLTVVDITLKRGIRLALLASLGAGLVEAVQAMVALRFSWFFTDDPNIGQIIQWAATVIFFALGLFYLLKKSKAGEAPRNRKSGSIFLTGIGVSALNFLAYPYWIFYGSWLQLNGWLVRETGHLLVFSLGVGLGTFFLLWTYAGLSKWIMSRSDKISLYADRFIGILMLGFGIWQLLHILKIA